jgi:signal transduction histidine kinase
MTQSATQDKKATEFISIASHQLRTPLGSMRWNFEMLLANEYGKIPKKIKPVLVTLYHSNLRMIRLVNNLLSISRIDQGRVVNNPDKCDVCELIKSIAAEIQAEAQKRGITGELHFPKKPIPAIVIDSKRLTEVLQNVLSNAIKYNKSNGLIKVFVKKSRKYILITVCDTGIGIPQNDIQKLCTKFYRSDNATAQTNEGTGLGLYIVKSYIEQWGGKIEIKSVIQKGTTVHLYLPTDPKK